MTSKGTLTNLKDPNVPYSVYVVNIYAKQNKRFNLNHIGTLGHNRNKCKMMTRKSLNEHTHDIKRYADQFKGS
jgi:hypothetical protein